MLLKGPWKSHVKPFVPAHALMSLNPYKALTQTNRDFDVGDNPSQKQHWGELEAFIL